jgi:hypothetical protein
VELAAGDRARSRDLLRGALRMDPANQQALTGLRTATCGVRTAGALLVQAERWARPLCGVAAVFAGEMAAALVWGEGFDLLFAVGYSLFVLGTLGASMLWVRTRHPQVGAELRLAGPDGIDAREARQVLVMLIFFLLLAPVPALG